MIWKISLSKKVERFLEKQRISQKEIFRVVKKSIDKLQGRDVNVDIKKLKGAWAGFYRSRVGKIRIIVEFNFDNFSAFIERVDFRGNVYK